MKYLHITDHILINALHEDIGNGDITTAALIPETHISKAEVVAKKALVLAGLPFAERTFQLIDDSIKFSSLKKDGSRVRARTVVAKISGRTVSLLKAERVALNVLQRCSGIATLTAAFVAQVKDTDAKITDTRKTAPGLRFFDKYAVRTGGGRNHRHGLFDGVLIKDNHIAAVGGIRKAVRLVRSKTQHLLKIEVEVKNIREVQEALSAGADVIMLDNMNVDMVKKAVSIIHRKNVKVLIEASGNVTLENVRSIAKTGVDMISAGALTHSAPAADISMNIVSK